MDSKRYEESVSQLYRSSLEQFVAERKRLAAELKTGGDKESAKRLEKLPRPSLPAWSVNQLWWHARADFEELFASAARLRSGDLGATRAHREVLQRLRSRAAEILRAGSHAATETALRRVANTLAALAANGTFAPDVPGALANDRDAPGFDAAGLSGMFAAVGAGSGEGAATLRSEDGAARDAGRPDSNASRQREQEQEEQRKRAALEVERKRQQEERQRLEARRAAARAERQKLDAELQRARAAVEAQVHAVERLRNALASEAQALEHARAAAGDIEARLLRVSEVLAEGGERDPSQGMSLNSPEESGN